MRILLMTNSAIGRWGYSIVGSKVADALQEAGHQVMYLGMQTLSPPQKLDNGIVTLGIRYHYLAQDVLKDYLWTYNINLLITLFDVWLPDACYITELCKQQRVTWLAHATIFTDPISPYLRTNLSMSNAIIAPSKYNLDALNAAGLGTQTNYIPHGIDLDTFKPMGEKVRQRWREKLGIPQDAFVALSVMRNNHPGKNYPALFKAWKIATKESREFRENAKLLILADPIEPKGLRLDYLRKMYEIEDSAMFIWAKPSTDLATIEPTYENDNAGMLHNANMGFDSEAMAHLYNVADVHVMSSAGESFSLPTIEAQACGVPCIATNFSTGVELIGEPKAGLLANVAAMTTHPAVLTDMAEVNPISLAEKMLFMFKEPEKRKVFATNALKNAKKYDIKKILPQWVELVNQLEEELVMKANYKVGRLGI